MEKECEIVPSGGMKPKGPSESEDEKTPLPKRVFPESALGKKLRIKYDTAENVRRQGTELLGNYKRLLGDDTKAIEILFKKHLKALPGKSGQNIVEKEQGLKKACHDKHIKDIIANLRAQKTFLMKQEKGIQDVFKNIESGNRPRIPNPFPKVISDLKKNYSAAFPSSSLIIVEELEDENQRPITASNTFTIGSIQVVCDQLENNNQLPLQPTNVLMIAKCKHCFVQNENCIEPSPMTPKRETVSGIQQDDIDTNIMTHLVVKDDPHTIPKGTKVKPLLPLIKIPSSKSVFGETNNKKLMSSPPIPISKILPSKPLLPLKNKTNASPRMINNGTKKPIPKAVAHLQEKHAFNSLPPLKPSAHLPEKHIFRILPSQKKAKRPPEVDMDDIKYQLAVPLVNHPEMHTYKRLPPLNRKTVTSPTDDCKTRRPNQPTQFPTNFAKTYCVKNFNCENSNSTRTRSRSEIFQSVSKEESETSLKDAASESVIIIANRHKRKFKYSRLHHTTSRRCYIPESPREKMDYNVWLKFCKRLSGETKIETENDVHSPIFKPNDNVEIRTPSVADPKDKVVSHGLDNVIRDIESPDTYPAEDQLMVEDEVIMSDAYPRPDKMSQPVYNEIDNLWLQFYQCNRYISQHEVEMKPKIVTNIVIADIEQNQSKETPNQRRKVRAIFRKILPLCYTDTETKHSVPQVHVGYSGTEADGLEFFSPNPPKSPKPMRYTVDKGNCFNFFPSPPDFPKPKNFKNRLANYFF